MNKIIFKKSVLRKEMAVLTNMIYDYMNGEIPEDTLCDLELEGRLQDLDTVGKIELLKSEIKWRKEKVNKINSLLKGA